MPRRHIEDTPTDSPYMWDDVVSYVLQEGIHEGIELEDNSGYIMSESWNGTLDGGLYPETWEDYMSRDVIKVRRRLRRS